jgi:glycosyltransferase involved in cell wall biosynthesis
VFPGVEHFGDKSDIVYADYSKKRLTKENYITSCALVDRATYLKAGGMCPEIKYFEDYDFWLRLASKNLGGKLLREPLFRYRRHSQGRSSQIYAKTKEQDYVAELRGNNPVVFGDLPVNHELTRDLPCYREIDVSGDESKNKEILSLAKNAAELERLLPTSSALYLASLVNLIQRETRSARIVPYHRKWHNDQRGLSVMYIIPWMVMGGADLYDLHILGAIRKMDSNAHITLVTCVETPHSWEKQFSSLVSEIFYLPRISNDTARIDAILDHLLLSRNVDVVFSRNNDPGYRAFERWRTHFELADLRLVDILHLENKAYEQQRDTPQPGWEEKSERVHSFMSWRIVASQNLLSHIALTQSAVSSEKFTVLYPAVDSKTCDPSNMIPQATLCSPAMKREAKFVTFIGRFEEQKDPATWVRVAIEISKANQDAVFLMIGTGWMRPLAEFMVKEAKLSSRFVFTGLLDHTEVLRYLALSDVLLLTSIYEGVPIVILEGKRGERRRKK